MTTSALTKKAVSRLPVGQRIRWARERKGISQEKLAAMIGTSRRHMIRVEKGQHMPGRKLVARIAEATEQPEKFFEADDEESSLSQMSIDDLLRLRARQILEEERIALEAGV